MKLGILSEFSDTPSVMSKGEFRLKEAATDKKSRSAVTSKKKNFGSKLFQNMRMKAQGKKFSSFKLLKVPNQAPPEGGSCAATHQKKDSQSYSSDVPEKSKSHPSATARHWTCSKSSDLPKKFKNKDSSKASDYLVSVAGNLAGDKHTCSGKLPAVKGQTVKYSRSIQDLPTSPKTKSSVLLSSLDNGQLLKCTRLSMSSATSSGSKKEDIDISLLNNSDLPNMTMAVSNFCQSAEKQANPALRNNFQLRRQSVPPMEADSSEKSTTLTEFIKCKSTSRIGKRGETSSDISEGIQGCARDCDIPFEHANKKLRILQSKILQNSSDHQQLVEEDFPSMSISEIHAKPIVQESFHKEVMHHFHVSYCESVNEHIQLAEGMEFRGGIDSADQLTDACIISHVDKEPNFRGKKSSITSQRRNREHALSIDKEPSGSLVSTASYTCLPSLKGTPNIESLNWP